MLDHPRRLSASRVLPSTSNRTDTGGRPRTYRPRSRVPTPVGDESAGSRWEVRVSTRKVRPVVIARRHPRAAATASTRSRRHHRLVARSALAPSWPHTNGSSSPRPPSPAPTSRCFHASGSASHGDRRLPHLDLASSDRAVHDAVAASGQPFDLLARHPLGGARTRERLPVHRGPLPAASACGRRGARRGAGPVRDAAVT